MRCHEAPCAACMSSVRILHVFLRRFLFRPHRLPACGASLFRAYRMRPRARLSRRRAYRAPDCACARRTSAGRTSPVRSVGIFSRRREAGGEAASGCRFLLPHPSTDISGSSSFEELIPKRCANCCFARFRERVRGGTPSGLARPGRTALQSDPGASATLLALRAFIAVEAPFRSVGGGFASRLGSASAYIDNGQRGL